MTILTLQQFFLIIIFNIFSQKPNFLFYNILSTNITSHNEDSGTEVWPNSGTWTFQNGDKNKLQRNDGVVMSISVTETTLRTSFTVSGGIKDGNWVFDFVK